MLGGQVALIVTFHVGALIVAAVIAAIIGALALFLTRRSPSAARLVIVAIAMLGTLMLAYESLTRSIHVDGIDVEVVDTDADADAAE